jgi:TPR repeat protein
MRAGSDREQAARAVDLGAWIHWPKTRQPLCSSREASPAEAWLKPGVLGHVPFGIGRIAPLSEALAADTRACGSSSGRALVAPIRSSGFVKNINTLMSVPHPAHKVLRKGLGAASRRALYQLGRAYVANQQLPEAISAYRKAADKGSTSAMVELGVLLAAGSGIPKDEAQARKLFERAAEAGNPRGVTNLAALSDSGGSPSDPVKARALLSKAAETNSAEAQYRLGLMIADGIGGPKDDVAARALFEKAAAQGHPGALERMGAFAQSGRGGPQDSTAAKARFTRKPRRLVMKTRRLPLSTRNVPM